MTQTRVDLESTIDASFDDPKAVESPDVRAAREEVNGVKDSGEFGVGEKIDGEG